MRNSYDVVIVGSGTSGSFVAASLVERGLDCVVLEAGSFYTRETYPEPGVEASSSLFWGGGFELNTDNTIGFLRPKCVGGGSVVNQALLDRYDEPVLASWRDASGVEWFRESELEEWYQAVEDRLTLRAIPADAENRNAEIFREGCEANGFEYERLKRAERDCRYGDGNDCIACLSGCRLDSKESTPVTVLKDALEGGLTVVDEFRVRTVAENDDGVVVTGRHRDGRVQRVRGDRLVLAAGAVGNAAILHASPIGDRLSAVGSGFYSHPQCMVFGRYDERVAAHEGAFQSLTAKDPAFREAGFKLENVFATPGDIGLLLPGGGATHGELMGDLDSLACIEVAIRDTEPGRIATDEDGEPVIHKRLNDEDRSRLEQGIDAIRDIFDATGATDVVVGRPNIGLHLMGGCPIGTDPEDSVTDSDFRIHGTDRIYAADSSVFPEAPGLNPAMTIMALSVKAGAAIAGEVAG